MVFTVPRPHADPMNETTIDPDRTTHPSDSGPPSRRRLYRSSDDRIISGVAGGIAEYFDIDAVIVRIALVVLTLAGGAGLVGYIAAWVLLPERDGNVAWREGGRWSHGHRRPTRADARQLGAIALVGLGAVMLLDRIGIGIDGGIAWPVALIGGGAAVLWGQRNRDDDPSGPDTVSGRGSPDGGSSDGGSSDGGSSDGPETGGPDGGRSEGPETDAGTAQRGDASAAIARRDDRRPSARARRRAGRAGRTPFARAALGLFVALAGAVLLAARLGALDHGSDRHVDGALALLLIAFGAVLTIGAWLGRPRGFILLGLLTGGVLIASSAIDVSWSGGFGERSITPTNATMQPSYRLTAGSLHLDLSGIDMRHQRVRIAGEVSMGRLLIEVPKDVKVVVEGKAAAGHMVLFGDDKGGSAITQEAIKPGTTESDGTLYIAAKVGLGELEVARVGHVTTANWSDR